MRVMIGLAGTLAAALGIPWLLQGLGLVHLRPVRCLAGCAEVQGPSPTWAVIGAIVILLGAGGLGYALFGRRRQERSGRRSW